MIVLLLLGMLLSASAKYNFGILAVDLSPTEFNILWSGAAGKTYAVMTTADLMSNSWETAVSGTNASCQSVVKVVVNDFLVYIEQEDVAPITNRFYKIVAHDVPDGMVLIPEKTNSGIDPDNGAYSLVIAFF